MAPQFAIYPSLKDRAVVVTGGASGIGAEIVAAFAAQGAQVGFLDMDAEGSARCAAEHPGVTYELCDLRDIPAMRTAGGSVRAHRAAHRADKQRCS